MKHSERRLNVAGAAHFELPDSVAFIDLPEAVFEAMLTGWVKQQRSRTLASETIATRISLIRRFQSYTNDYPWHWTPEHQESFTANLFSEKKAAKTTVRSYQSAIRLFLDYVIDPRYDWVARCDRYFGETPIQICHEWNTSQHNAEFEGRPGRRPLTFDEIQCLFDYADTRVQKIRALGRKGSLAAYRDATLFKVAYAWGLRRREVRRLDLADFLRNRALPDWGKLASIHVRYGKGVKGGPPRRRLVLSLPEFEWAIEALRQYLDDVRPAFGYPKHPAVFVTERGGYLLGEDISNRFRQLVLEAGLPDDLELHCLRHSYSTHLAEYGYDPEFIREQLGHEYLSTTGIYTHVSSDYKQFVVREALQRAYEYNVQRGHDGRER